ncbi:MAG: SRPBCC family protein [Actinomycetota bacterium]|nr:SRPBCC family protein [Actinomycetota bacterium]MDQ3648498.1 SRPBCC family protein [Actinomycetota bacterium]
MTRAWNLLELPEYSFRTTWLVRAPREEVFQVIWDSERWPEWWRGVQSVVKLEEGDSDGVGSLGRYSWRSRLPYTLEFDTRIIRVERPHLLEGHATGELEGTGLWRLFEQTGLTAVVYDWRVRTTRPWMNLLAPVAKPLFAWNHDAIMSWGAEGLAGRLGAPPP